MSAVVLLLAVAAASPEALVEQVRAQGAGGVSLVRVQMDGDESLEAVVRYELAGSGVHAVVLDSDGTGWREAGRFNSWWSYEKADGERFLELRETVAAGVTDLIVRTRSGGTEEARTTVEIFRLHAGKAVNVLTVTEYLSAMEHPSGVVVTTKAAISVSVGRVVVRESKNPGPGRGCVAYRWDERAFRFSEEAGGCGE